MNRSLALLVAAALGLSAFAAACASETVGASTGATEPEATSSSGGDVGDPNDDPNGDDDQPQGGPKSDAGPNKGDAGPNKGDAGSQKEAGPPAVTKAEIQALFDARRAPCHIGSASAGLSLANDFTTSTVGVASTQVPNMKRIAAGDKDASYLFHKLRGTHQTVGGSGLRMPRTGPPFLSDADIDRVGAFIDAL